MIRFAPVLFVLLLAAGTVSAADAGTVPEWDLKVSLERQGGWRLLDARLPGRIVGYALPRVEGERREILVLIEPHVESPPEPDDAEPERKDDDGLRRLPPCPEAEAEPESRTLELFLIDPDARNDPRLLSDRIPGDITAIDVIDVERDGREELMLARTGELFVLDPRGDAEPRSVLRESGMEWLSFHPRAVEAPELDGWPAVGAPGFGTFDVYTPDATGDAWSLRFRVDTPLDGVVSPDGLQITSHLPRFIGRRTDGAFLFGTWAEQSGAHRIGTRLIEILPGAEPIVVESWSRLPTAETMIEQHYLMLDDGPVLMLTTKPANKLNLFGEKLLRLFPVSRDRSRLGRHPLYEVETRANMWQSVTSRVVDVNADGRKDLILGYWKGIKDDRIVLDVYLREQDGWFGKKPRSTGFDIKDGDRSWVGYGQDITGDGRADLMVRAGNGRLRVFPGLASKDGKKIVAREPLEVPFDVLAADSEYDSGIEISLGGGAQVWMETSGNRPLFVDLDGDGAMEMLFIQSGGAAAPGLFRVLAAASD